MVKIYTKRDFPVEKVRRFLEPGPIVLVSCRLKDEINIMTMGWHTVMDFSPPLIGCMITSANYSYEMIKKSGECVINIPTVDLTNKVIGIGNCSGEATDKFEKFELTASKATKVKAPLIRECYANFECKLVDRKMLSKYNFFIFEVVKSHVATSPKYPKTIHYRGDGIFMESGRNTSHKARFLPQNL